MKQSGKQIENIFEEDRIINDLCIKYYVIKRDFESKKYPPKIDNYLKRFKADYHIELTEEEFVELKDYAENDYSDNVVSKMQQDFDSGRLQNLF
jgi:hypothetical protein